METPTKQELEGFKVVSAISDPSWRHGTRETHVFHRPADDTYWEVKFRLSSDGETNEFYSDEYEIKQVKPEQKVITVYV